MSGDKQNHFGWKGYLCYITSGGMGSVVDGWRECAGTYRGRDTRRSRRRCTRALHRPRKTSEEASEDARTFHAASAGNPVALRSP